MHLSIPFTTKAGYIMRTAPDVYAYITYDEKGEISITERQYNDIFKIKLYKKERSIQTETLYILSMLKIHIPKDYRDFILDNINYISGHRLNTHLGVKFIGWFTKPLVFNYMQKRFRIIPELLSYAISSDGDVINVLTKQCLSVYIHNGYKAVNILGNVCYIHRLLGSAWIENDDRINKVVIDHIDGDRQNNNIKNLRWVTTADNNKAAIQQGLSTQSQACKIKNLNNGIIKTFNSFTDLTEHFGISRINSKIVSLGDGRPYIKKIGNAFYQVKYVTDDTPWITLSEALKLYKMKSSKCYILTIGNSTFSNLAEISRFINNGKKYTSLQAAIDYIKNDMGFEINLRTITVDDKKHFIAHNIKTNEVLYAVTLKEFEELTGNNKSAIYKSMINNGAYVYNNWRYKHDNGEEFRDLNQIDNVPKDVKAVSLNTKSVLVFKSIREAARHFNVDPKIVKKYIANKKPLNSYRLSLL